MGILDDLAMGFGLKERTADYDARTARTIAANEAEQAARAAGAGDHAAMVAGIRARQNYNPSEPTAQGRYFLDRAGARGGYEAGTYTPTIAEDNRSFMQRALFSPESDPSPSPYAIGPLQMDQPLPAFGMMGLIKALAGGGNKKPLPSGAISALEGGTLKAPNKVARPLSILPADDGQITEEELADVTGEDTLGTFTPEEMETADLLTELNARFDATGDDPTVGIDRQPLYDAGYSDGFIDRLTQDDRNKIFAMHVGKAFR